MGPRSNRSPDALGGRAEAEPGFCAADSLAVMSVDLGSESMKVALVKPGVPMEIVLNK